MLVSSVVWRVTNISEWRSKYKVCNQINLMQFKVILQVNLRSNNCKDEKCITEYSNLNNFVASVNSLLEIVL